jgi:hypothetical protein
MTTKLNENAIIAKRTKAGWSASVTDKELTKDIINQKDMSEDAGKWQLYLISKKHFERLHANSRKFDKFHNERTIPWNGKSEGLLPTKMFKEYDEGMKALIQERAEIVRDDLVFKWEDIKLESKSRLGDRYNEADFPNVLDLEQMFKAGVEYYPIPPVDSLQLRNLLSGDIETIQNMAKEKQAIQLEEGMRDVWRRIYEIAQRIADTLKEPEKKFQKTMIEDAVEMARLIPQLNITDDPELNSLKDRLENEIVKYDPKTLRESLEARKEVADAAQKMLDSISESQPALRSLDL